MKSSLYSFILKYLFWMYLFLALSFLLHCNTESVTCNIDTIQVSQVSLSSINIKNKDYSQYQIADVTPVISGCNIDTTQINLNISRSVDIGSKHHNQPHFANGHLIFTGNGVHDIFDICNPASPRHIVTLQSEHRYGEVEFHSVSFSKDLNSSIYMVIGSGIGIDIWDITDPPNSRLLNAFRIPGV